MSTQWRDELHVANDRVFSSKEVQEKPWVPTRPELLWTVATEDERTRAAVVSALRLHANKQYLRGRFRAARQCREFADAVANGANY